MISPKAMQSISKMAGMSIKNIVSENKLQNAILADMAKALSSTKSDGGVSKSLKEISSTLQKAAKLIEAQTTLLTNLKPEDLEGEGADDEAEGKAKELADAIKKITDENKKQSTEIDSLLAEVEKAAKEAGDDKDASKKIKAATQALEKAVKLIDEQSKLLDEARKALAA